MAQELLDVGTGRVYRRAGAGWQEVLQGETDAAMLSELGVGELLWEGEFMSGSITVPGISQYSVLLVKITGNYNSGQFAMLYVSDVAQPDGIRYVTGGYNGLGGGGMVSTLGYSMNLDNETEALTCSYARPGYLYFAENNSKWDQGIVKIYGLIKRAGDVS